MVEDGTITLACFFFLVVVEGTHANTSSAVIGLDACFLFVAVKFAQLTGLLLIYLHAALSLLIPYGIFGRAFTFSILSIE